MSVESVKQFLASHAPDVQVMELEVSTATVDMAAEGHGVEPDQIAKTLALRLDSGVILIVASGRARIDNKKFKAVFSTKPRMLPLDEVEHETGHPIGGVCPIGLMRPIKVYCDISLKAHVEVIPAAGGTNAAIRISPLRLAEISGAEWIDVCQ